MKRQTIRINESQLKEMVSDAIKQILKENFNSDDYFNDLNNMVDNPKEYFQEEEMQYPEDVCEWGRKVQQLGLELSRLCGKYRFENDELYENLKQIEEEYNAVCGDLNTLDIASHWDS